MPENPPYWLPGTAVTAWHEGPLVRIVWDAPAGGDPVSAYQINLGTYNGTGVALVPASVRECYITGLAADTSYTIVVTARDAQMHWSGPLPGTQGNRTTTVTTASHGNSGSLWCHVPTDGDNDGLPDALETNDGTYASASDAGTDPANPDTDNDGILDGYETLGGPGLDLIGMGASPTHKDLLIETDWIDGSSCSIEPTAARLAPMIAAFANAPADKVTSPDGAPGINLIVDYGQGGHFTGGSEIPDPDGSVDGQFEGQHVGGSYFAAAKAAHFAPARHGIFHYSIINQGGLSTGVYGGADTYINGACTVTDPLVFPGTFMHELGHNLDLYHGGGPSIPSNDPEGPDSNLMCEEAPDTSCYPKVHINNKPNYVSVMNYTYIRGVNDSCLRYGGTGTKWLDYSDGSRATISEATIDETTGICNGVDFDFNGNGTIDTTPYRDDINGTNGDGLITPLHDHDDWTHINEVGLTYVN